MRRVIAVHLGKLTKSVNLLSAEELRRYCVHKFVRLSATQRLQYTIRFILVPYSNKEKNKNITDRIQHELLHHATISNHHLFACLASSRTHRLDLFHDIHSVNHLAEHDMAAVQVTRFGSADEELRPVGAWAGVGHGQNSRPSVLQVEVLVGELFTENGLAARPISIGEVSPLAHETRNYPMETGALVVQRLSTHTIPLLTCAETFEVLARFGCNVVPELHDDLAHVLPSDSHLEEHLRQRTLLEARFL